VSEFQSYTWTTLHRRLTAQEQQAVNKLSSHIDVTPTGAEVTYEWGDFKHDPIQVLSRYFDAFMYYTNWGTRQLALRFPRKLIGAEPFAPFLWEEFVELQEEGDSYILIVGIGLDGAETGSILTRLSRPWPRCGTIFSVATTGHSTWPGWSVSARRAASTWTNLTRNWRRHCRPAWAS
jgi:hypothetical protein